MTNDYNKMQKAIFSEVDLLDKKQKLLLHSCCAPCSTTCLERVVNHFDTNVFYYNPNITDLSEYEKRLDEQKTFVKKAYNGQVKVIDTGHNPNDFYSAVKGYETEPERGKRCYICYKLRLEKTAITAKDMGYDYFTSTLSLSPYKNAEWLNKIGEELSKKYGVKYLYADFKKEGGYLRSIKLSEEYGLYRQNYCGCEYSKQK